MAAKLGRNRAPPIADSCPSCATGPTRDDLRRDPRERPPMFESAVSVENFGYEGFRVRVVVVSYRSLNR